MQLIARGRDADVYAIDDASVLRRYRDADASCEHEARVMEWVRRQGYPVPAVLSFGGPEMVLERIDGPTMVESMLAGTTTLDQASRTMAELLERLHELAPPPEARPGAVVRHLDLHPFNIIEAATGPVVIDWRNTDLGAGGVDTALTAVILAQAALVPMSAAELAAFGISPDQLTGLTRKLMAAYLGHAGPLPPNDVAAALRLRARDPNLTEQERTALEEVPALLLPPSRQKQAAERSET